MWVIRSDKVDHFRKKGQYIEQKEGVRFMEQFIVQIALEGLILVLDVPQ